MLRLLCAFALAIICAVALPLYAVSPGSYWNDSESVNFPLGAPDSDPPEEGVDIVPNDIPPDSGSGPGSGAWEGAPEQGPSSEGGTESSDSESFSSVLGTEATVTVSNAPSEGGPSGQELLEVLTDGGALTASRGGSSADATNVRISIIGSKVRNAVKSNGTFFQILGGIHNRGKAITRADLGLIAASTALTDSRVEEVFFRLNEFSISYRSLGYFFGFVPAPFTVRVTVNPALEEADRVNVKLPWYQFFLRKLFSPEALTNSINGEIRSQQNNPEFGKSLSDDQARLFLAVVALLQSQTDVVEGSIGEGG